MEMTVLKSIIGEDLRPLVASKTSKKVETSLSKLLCVWLSSVT